MDESYEVKITPEQFKVFKAECEKWLDYFGLKNWQVRYMQSKIDNRAEVHFNCVGGVATIILGHAWNEKSKNFVDNESIKKCAFHEVCELLFGRLNDMAGQRWGLAVEDVEEEIHRIIRILENTTFKDLVGGGVKK